MAEAKHFPRSTRCVKKRFQSEPVTTLDVL